MAIDTASVICAPEDAATALATLIAAESIVTNDIQSMAIGNSGLNNIVIVLVFDIA